MAAACRRQHISQCENPLNAEAKIVHGQIIDICDDFAVTRLAIAFYPSIFLWDAPYQELQ